MTKKLVAPGTKADLIQRVIDTTLQYGEDNGSCRDGIIDFLADALGVPHSDLSEKLAVRRKVTMTIEFIETHYVEGEDCYGMSYANAVEEAINVLVRNDSYAGLELSDVKFTSITTNL